MKKLIMIFGVFVQALYGADEGLGKKVDIEVLEAKVFAKYPEDMDRIRSEKNLTRKVDMMANIAKYPGGTLNLLERRDYLEYALTLQPDNPSALCELGIVYGDLSGHLSGPRTPIRTWEERKICTDRGFECMWRLVELGDILANVGYNRMALDLRDFRISADLLRRFEEAHPDIPRETRNEYLNAALYCAKKFMELKIASSSSYRTGRPPIDLIAYVQEKIEEWKKLGIEDVPSTESSSESEGDRGDGAGAGGVG